MKIKILSFILSTFWAISRCAAVVSGDDKDNNGNNDRGLLRVGKWAKRLWKKCTNGLDEDACGTLCGLLEDKCCDICDALYENGFPDIAEQLDFCPCGCTHSTLEPLVFDDLGSLAVGESLPPVSGDTTGGGTNPTSCGFSYSPTLWYKLAIRPDPQTIVISLCGSIYDTYLIVHGCSVLLGCNDDFCGFAAGSQVSFSSTSPETLYIGVSGFGSSHGPYTLDISSTAI